MSPSYLSPLKSTPLSRRDTDYSKDASPTSQEEDELYECDLSSFAHQFNFTRTKAESLTLDEFLGVPANRASKTDSLLGGLLPQGTLSDLSDLLAELDNIEATAPQTSARRLSMLLLPEDNEEITSDSPTQAVPLTELEKKIEIAKKRLENANLKKLTTTIYLFDAQNPQTVQITSLSTPETIIQNFLDNGKLQSQHQWVITEIHEAFGVERIMKPWEPILDVIDAWEAECHSALLIRVRQNESTTPEVPRDAPLMAGTLQIEVRRGKWEKRFVILKRGGIYLAKNESSVSSATLLCSMQNFDAFTLNRPRVKSPKKPQFALKSQQSIALFEKPEDDYIHFFACSSPAERDTWMRALRYSRSWVHYEMFLSRPATAALFSPFVDEGILTDHLIGIELDQGQYAELEAGAKANGSSTLTRNTPGAIAGRLFRLVLTGDQGKTDIDRVVGSKALPNVFSEGSLLSKPHAPKPAAPTEEAEPVAEDGEVFKEGSLLSRKLSTKKVPGSGPLLDYQPQSGSLLDSIESSQKGAKVKPQPLTILGGKGGASTLLQLKTKDSGVFQTGTLLSKNASTAHSGSNKPPISLSQWTGPTGNSSGGTPSTGAGSSPATLFSAGSSSLPGGRQGTLGGALCESPTSPLAPTLPGSRDPRTRDSPPEPTPVEVTAAEKSPTSNRVSNVISQQQQIRKQKSQRAIPARNHTNQGPSSGMRDPAPLRSYKSGPLLANVQNDGKSPLISRHHSSRATPGSALKPPPRQPVQMHPHPPNFQNPHYHPGMPRPAGPPPHGHFQYPTHSHPHPHPHPHPHSHAHPHPAPHQRKHQSTHPGMAPLLPPMAPPPHALPRNSIAPPPPNSKAGPLLHLAPPSSMPNMPNMMHHPQYPHSTKKPPMKPLLSFK